MASAEVGTDEVEAEDSESPFLDEQMAGTASIPDVTERLEPGDDEGTFAEERAESEDSTLEELEADEPAEAETAWAAEGYDAESEGQEPEVSAAYEDELEGATPEYTPDLGAPETGDPRKDPEELGRTDLDKHFKGK